MGVLALTLPLFGLGALLMALGARGRDAAAIRARWFKFTGFFVIVHALVLAAALGRNALTTLAGAIVLACGWELYRALRRLPPGRRWPWLPAPLLFLGFLGACHSLAPARVLHVFLVSAAFDGFSQVTGQWLGRRPLAPTISPAKTVEGLAGGLGAALLASMALAPLAGLGYARAAGLGLAVGLAALSGDLAGSWTKRRAGIKDFSHLLPGQGGALDRFNSFIAALTLAAPWF